MPRAKGVKNVKPARKWTEEEIEFLRVNYPIYDRNELLAKFNEHFSEPITQSSLKATLGRYKIFSGRTGLWQKGHTSWNKGLKWDDYLSPESQASCRRTQFNKERTMNNANHNEVPVGTEREYDGYVYIRQEVRNEKSKAYRWWKLKHHIIWEEANGPIPKDHVVIFADGDTHNFDLDNLILIKRCELAVINKVGLYYKGNGDATKCGVTLAKLMMKGKSYAKKQINRFK